MLKLTMKNIFSPRKFGRGLGRNPFLKKGDCIYVYSKSGKFKVIAIEEDCFIIIPGKAKDNLKSSVHTWKDFRGWCESNHG